MDKISKHKNELQLANTAPENVIFSNVSQIIEKRKFNVISAANNQIALMFWEIGKSTLTPLFWEWSVQNTGNELLRQCRNN